MKRSNPIRLARITLAFTSTLLLAAPGIASGTEAPTVESILTGYAEARGGKARWQAAKTLEVQGTYALFSERHPFTLVKTAEDHYRLDFTMLGNPAIRARDAEGPWWVHPLLRITAPTRVEDGPYVAQIEREATFAPLLLDPKRHGATITFEGTGDVDGQPTLDLAVTFADGSRETWFLDQKTYLEVAVDSMVADMTQSMQPVRMRTFFSDFREVDGLVLPHHLELEFGARLEVMQIDSVRTDGEIDAARVELPGPPTSSASAGNEDG